MTPFVGGYHVDAIAEHLVAISQGQLQNLIINIPPRHGKSTLVAVLWPTWEWIAAPSRRFLCASYSLALSIRDSLKCRRLIESAWYQQQWGMRYQLTTDQNQKMRFENDHTGYRLATSVGGVGTGEGGDRLIIDDPHNAEEIESELKRQSVLDWWDGAMSTRGNQAEQVARVIVMQRLHERDLVGHILDKQERGGTRYDHLVLPAEYEPRAQLCLADLPHDPRTVPDAPLAPDRFPPAVLATLKSDLGPERASGQLQQRPAPLGGAVFQRAWWEARNRYDPTIADVLGTVAGRWLFVDTALKEGAPHDFTACGTVELLADYRARVRDLWTARLAFPSLVADLEATVRRWSADTLLRGIVIEDKGSGTSAIQTLQEVAQDLAVPVIAFEPRGSKVYRARQASLWAARGCLLLPEPHDTAPWLFNLERELFSFPAAAHDDQVDVLVMATLYLEHLLADGWRAREGRAA